MAFFSGYPLIYAFVFFIAGFQHTKTSFISTVASLLPFAYAFVGTLFLGLQIRNLYPDFSIENIALNFNESYLKIWGLLSLLFWIPFLGKKPILSLIHSLVFFFYLTIDLFLYAINSSVAKADVKNEMKIYSDSLILNLAALVVILLIYFFLRRFKIIKDSSLR